MRLREATGSELPIFPYDTTLIFILKRGVHGTLSIAPSDEYGGVQKITATLLLNENHIVDFESYWYSNRSL